MEPGCPCHTNGVAQPQTQARQSFSNMFDNLDFKQLLMFAGVGILFVVVVDAVVRLAGSSSSSTTKSLKDAITIDGRSYVPV